MSKFLWGKTKDAGIVWRSRKRLSVPKSHGGLGFCSIQEFNITMLGKQSWRLMTSPNTLLAQVLKGKYYPDCDLLEAKIGRNPSYTWRSLCASFVMLKNGCSMRVW